MPVLDSLAREGLLSRLRTVPPGLSVGSEHALPTLLGWPPPAPVDRGMLEAAAQELSLGDGERAWRLDVRAGGERADEATVERVAAELVALLPRHALSRLAGHGLLLSGRGPLPDLAREDVWVWPEGVVPPPLLTPATVVVAARGAAAGTARLMGATVVVPEGATGSLDTNLGSKARATGGRSLPEQTRSSFMSRPLTKRLIARTRARRCGCSSRSIVSCSLRSPGRCARTPERCGSAPTTAAIHTPGCTTTHPFHASPGVQRHPNPRTREDSPSERSRGSSSSI